MITLTLSPRAAELLHQLFNAQSQMGLPVSWAAEVLEIRQALVQAHAAVNGARSE